MPCSAISLATDHSTTQCRNHEDAIYPTTKLSKINPAFIPRRRRVQCPLSGNQERQGSVVPGSRSAQLVLEGAPRDCLVPSQFVQVCLGFRLTRGEATEYRAGSIGRQLGVRFSRVVQIRPLKPVFSRLSATFLLRKLILSNLRQPARGRGKKMAG